MSDETLNRANVVALIVPAALMAGALGSQYLGGLVPCEMCQWQRWPHYAAIVLALAAFVTRPTVRPMLIALAALAILTSAGIGAFHAGVEYGWWPGPAHCTRLGGGSLADVLRTPVVSCDKAQWTLGGISLAGFNMIFSAIGGFAVLGMLRRGR